MYRTRCNRTNVPVFSALAVACLLATVGSAWAGPASGEPCTLTQPDGATFPGLVGGDEWFNWVSHEGLIIVQDATGWWCYAQLRDGVPRASRNRVGSDKPPANALTLEDVPTLAQGRKPAPHSYAPEPPATARAVSRDMLVIMVEFTDRTFTTTDAYWQNLFFGASGKTVRTYFDQISGGNLTLLPAAETFGTANDGIVRVQLNYAHPNPNNTIDDSNRWITHDALVAANAFVAWPALDLDNDTYLTPQECHIVLVVAGYEAGCGTPLTPAIWSHRWALGFTWVQYVPAPNLQGVHLCDYVVGGGYCQVGELHGTHAGTVGVPCHELGHDMGLPDLYDTTYASDGIGGHGVMGYGCWGRTAADTCIGQTPTHPCAWSKIQLGFATPTLASGNQDYSLYSSGSPAYNAVRVNTPDQNQYFLIENRQLSGYDEGLYRWFSLTSGGTGGGGLAIWHVDESVVDNTNPARKRVDLEEANEGILGWSELDYRPPYPQDPVPYQGNRHHYFYAGHVADWGDASVPSSQLYGGGTTYVNVSAVSVSGPTMKCYIATQHGSTQQREMSTYIGGWRSDNARDVAIGPNGDVYVAVNTNSSDYPTTPNAYDTQVGGLGGIGVSRFSPGGTLLYSTVLDSPGSSYAPYAIAIAVDQAGNAYITGQAYENLPTTAGAYDTTYNGGYSGSTWGDAFVAKFDPTMSNLLYCTYLGGSDFERAWGIQVDSSGNAYVAGHTNSSNFPHTLGSYGSNGDVFVTKLNASGSGLIYSRLFGASGALANGIEIDASGNAYIAGEVYFSFPTTVGAFQSAHSNPGYADVFVAKLDASGGVQYATYVGGLASDEGEQIALDAAGYVYVTGQTSSSDFPTTAGAYQTTYGGGGDAFVTKLHPSAYSGLEYSTYFGSSIHEYGYGLDVDGSGNAYFAGYDAVSGFDTNNAILVGLDDQGAALTLTEYFPGSARDEAANVAVAPVGDIYMVGYTESSDFPTTPNAFDPTLGGTCDGFLVIIGWSQVTDSLVVGSPDGGEILWITSTAQIRWSSSGAGAYVNVELSRSGYGGPWETLFSSTANDGSEDWTVAGAASSNCVVRITDASNGTLTDTSNAVFDISPYITGDMDCDMDSDFDDIDGFVVALTGQAAYEAQYPGCDWLNADCDDDGDVDFDDIDAFVAILAGGG